MNGNLRVKLDLSFDKVPSVSLVDANDKVFKQAYIPTAESLADFLTECNFEYGTQFKVVLEDDESDVDARA